MIEQIIVALISMAIGLSIGTYLQMKETRLVKIKAAMTMVLLTKDPKSKMAIELTKQLENFIKENNNER